MKVVKSLRHIYINEGVRGLWRSNTLACGLSAPFAAFEFFLYELYKNNLFAGLEKHELSFWQRFLCGGLTGATG